MAVESVRIIGLEGVLKTLRELPPELVSKHGGPVRSALRKASLLMVNEAKANVERIVAAPNVDGEFVSTGLLQKNIITKRMKIRQKGERYKVGIRTKAYPRPGRRATTTTQVGRLLEYGSEKRRPMPWLRPAFDRKKDQVIPLFVSELRKNLDRIVAKLAAKNGVS